jgi:hypothetical protein
MRDRRLLIAATVLLLTGAAGLLVSWVTLVAGGPTGGVTFASNGERIYYTGADASGPIPRTIAGAGAMPGFGMMAAVACVDCHGVDGRGGQTRMMYGGVDIPDIRYATLTGPRSEEGTTVPAWTESDIVRAVRDGVEPDGRRLEAPMPRWAITDTDATDLIGYLKELSAR